MFLHQFEKGMGTRMLLHLCLCHNKWIHVTLPNPLAFFSVSSTSYTHSCEISALSSLSVAEDWPRKQKTLVLILSLMSSFLVSCPLFGASIMNKGTQVIGVVIEQPKTYPSM
jgi:hypothetical protein